MALRRVLPCLVGAALLAVATTACDSREETGSAKGGVSLVARCEQMAKACGDKEKHVAKIVAECQRSGSTKTGTRCEAQAIAVYDCYEKQVCAGKDKVWALDDLRVLAERHEKCVAERDALRACALK